MTFGQSMKNAWGALSWGGAAVGTKMQASGPLARLGMMSGAGAIYGGTLGRDEGQSRLGGAFSGAIGGAGLYGAARYGRAGYRNIRNAGAGMGFGKSAMAIGQSFGKGAFARARRDFRSAGRSMGFKMNRAVNPVTSTLGAGMSSSPVPSNLISETRASPSTMAAIRDARKAMDLPISETGVNLSNEHVARRLWSMKARGM